MAQVLVIEKDGDTRTFLSGKSDRDDMARAFRSGAADYPGKPCSRADVINAVNSAVPIAAMLAPPREDQHRKAPHCSARHAARHLIAAGRSTPCVFHLAMPVSTS